MFNREILCDTEFWNSSLTWYTDKPQLTPCFRDTILVWLPAIIIWSTSFLHIINWTKSSRKYRKIPWNTINITKITFTSSLSLLKLLECFIHICYAFAIRKGEHDILEVPIYSGDSLVVSAFIVPFIQLSCFSLLTFIYYHHRKCGLHTSGLVWFFLLVSVLCGLPDFHSTILNISTATYARIQYVLRVSCYPILCALFLLDCIGDYPPPEPYTLDTRPVCPEVKASFCSKLTFWWYNTFVIDGYRRPITLSTLWQTQPKHQAQVLAPMFEEKWTSSRYSKKKFLSASGREIGHNHVALVMLKIFKWEFVVASLLKLLQDVLAYTTPVMLKYLLRFMVTIDDPQWHGTLLAISFLVVPTLQSLLLGSYFQRMLTLGIQARSMLVGAIYRKSLLLGSSSRQYSTTGEVVNLMAVDAQHFMDLMLYVNLLWSAPFQIIVAIFMLYQELGWSVFGGVACMLLMMPFNTYLANKIKLAQVAIMKTKDERIKQMNEILSGIKVLKLYAWENSFINSIIKFRIKELQYLKRMSFLDAFIVFGWSASPFLVAVVSLGLYVNLDSTHVLNAEKAFVSISLFNLLRFPLTMLPQLITTLVMTSVSIDRLNRFLNSDELMCYVTRNDESEAISIEDATVSWEIRDRSETAPVPEPILKDINLHVRKGSFIALVGQVASGKTSLLASIVGEMHRIKGRFNISRPLTIAYVPQQAWIQNLTVRDNILFGQEYDEQKYNRVMSACALYTDMASLPNGDQSEIGEKGINLSGGQKQRVSLARACYSNADIYLLDDPLSANDSHVAKHLYENILSSTTGLLKNKTRILATNSLFVLPYTDKIEVLKDGRIIESGTYEKLIDTDRGYFSEFMRQYSKTSNEKMTDSSSKGSDVKLTGLKSENLAFDSAKMVKRTPTPNSEAIAQNAGKLIETERAETGKVKFSVYTKYFVAASPFWLVTVIILSILSSSLNVANNLWLAEWSSDSDDPAKANDTDLRTTRLLVYGSLGTIQCVAVLLASFAMALGAIIASTGLHQKLLERVLHSPMNFFDTTPIGRIVNRFSKDIDVVDSTLPGTFRTWLLCLLHVISALFIVCYSFPYFVIVVLFLAITYHLIQRLFIATTRQLKRLESINRSPMYSHFGETLTGISVIRAYNCNGRFIDHNNLLVDRNQSCCYPNVIANRWLSIRLELFANLITACAAMFSVYNRDTVAAGIAGLTISYSMNITQTLSWLVRQTSELETNIVSVERISEYINNKIEDSWYKDQRPTEDWPACGAVEFKNYSTRYREDTGLVLRNLNLSIACKEKMGIVGRTGSGKSSLSLAIFRILESSKGGKILIDGLDTSEIGLHDLRSRLTIIPQDPVLFSGTLRFNLDPLELYTDERIWRALEMAHLKPYIANLQGGLQYKVSEFGENFSVGQKQLICLARAILRKSRILVLDEATAAVDLETDSLVLETIRKEFNDCTVITIAHRLHTILDSDRVLVLDGGQIKELDTPKALRANKNSVFSRMVDAADIKFN